VGAGAEPAARRRDQVGEDVLRPDAAGGRVALGAEDLADLEHVVPGAAVERDRGGGVVRVEVVVAAEAEDGEAAVERPVVVDALDGGGHLVVLHEVRVGGDRAVEQGDERRAVRGLGGAGAAVAARGRNAGGGPQQEDVVVEAGGAGVGGVGGVRAEDEGLVRAVEGGAGVEEVDDVVAHAARGGAGAGGVDGVGVGVRLAVEGEGVAGGHVHGLEVEDDEAVLAVVGGPPHHARRLVRCRSRPA